MYAKKNKPDTFIVYENNNKYCPKTKEELVENIKELIGKGVTNLNCIDTSKITDMSYLFERELSKINNINISKWDVSNVENMHSMFIYCENFEGKGLENWDVSNVKDMGHMFDDCKKFDCDLSGWNVSNVTNMTDMFANCESFKGKGLENWNVNNVTDMYRMFFNCKNFNCNLSKWNVSNVDNMLYLFDNCTSLKNTPRWYKE